MVSFSSWVIGSNEKILRTGGGAILKDLFTVSNEIVGQVVEVKWAALRSPAKQRRKNKRERKRERKSVKRGVEK